MIRRWWAAFWLWLTFSEPRSRQAQAINLFKDRSLRGKARRKARQGR